MDIGDYVNMVALYETKRREKQWKSNRENIMWSGPMASFANDSSKNKDRQEKEARKQHSTHLQKSTARHKLHMTNPCHNIGPPNRLRIVICRAILCIVQVFFRFLFGGRTTREDEVNGIQALNLPAK